MPLLLSPHFSVCDKQAFTDIHFIKRLQIEILAPRSYQQAVFQVKGKCLAYNILSSVLLGDLIRRDTSIFVVEAASSKPPDSKTKSSMVILSA